MRVQWKFLVGSVVAATVASVGAVALAGNGGAACGCAVKDVAVVEANKPATAPPTGVGTVTVPGSGTVQVEPDIAVLDLGVQATEVTGDAASTQVNADAQALTDALVAAGIAEEDIQTTGISLYSTTGDDGVTVTGYNASINLSVTIRDIEAVGATIDTAQEAAGTGFTIGGVSFSFADPESVLGQARIDALENARATAQQYADAAGATLGEVLSIVEGSSFAPVRYTPAADLAAAPAEGPPISPGQLDLTIQISATFAIS